VDFLSREERPSEIGFRLSTSANNTIRLVPGLQSGELC
jgi:hypothetical protein